MAQKMTPQNMEHRELQGSHQKTTNKLTKTIRTKSCRIWNLIKRYKSQGTLKKEAAVFHQENVPTYYPHSPDKLQPHRWQETLLEQVAHANRSNMDLVLKELPLCFDLSGSFLRYRCTGFPLFHPTQCSQEWGNIPGSFC